MRVTLLVGIHFWSMEAFTILSAVKILIDFFEDNYTGVATGILLTGIPGSELVTLGDSTHYLFDTRGNRQGTKDINGLKYIPINSFKLINENEVRIGFEAINRTLGFEGNDFKPGFN